MYDENIFKFEPPCSMLKNCNLLSLQMVRVVSPAGETGMLVVDSVVISDGYSSKHVFIIPIIALHIVLCHSIPCDF